LKLLLKGRLSGFCLSQQEELSGGAEEGEMRNETLTSKRRGGEEKEEDRTYSDILFRLFIIFFVNFDLLVDDFRYALCISFVLDTCPAIQL